MKGDLFPTLSPLSQVFTKLSSQPPPDKSTLSTQTSLNKLPQGTKIVGNYLLGKKIGQGTFGQVHMAMHIPTSEKVAIKIIDKSKMRPKDVQRVKSEIQILKTVRHRHIVDLYEIIETQKSLLLVTEFLPNGELFRHIVQNKKIPEEEACTYFQQIMGAVEYLHRNRIAHRDLKPQNILIDFDRQLKIIDFGLSTSYLGKTHLKTFCGSPCYAAPEMIEAKHSYNPELADTWSCGVILFAMLCGHLPFCDADTHTLFKKIMACNYKIPPHLSPEAQDLISKLLVANPAHRLPVRKIKQHPWFSRVPAGISHGLNRGEQLQVDEEVVEKARAVGVDEEKVREGIGKNQKNKETATYLILMKKLVKGGHLIPSYLASDRFNCQLISKDSKSSEDDYTQSFSNEPIQTPKAPQLPDPDNTPTPTPGDTAWWFKEQYAEHQARDIDEGELLLLANSILQIFLPMPTGQNHEIARVSEILSAPSSNEHPIKKLTIAKKVQDFYANKSNRQKFYNLNSPFEKQPQTFMAKSYLEERIGAKVQTQICRSLKRKAESKKETELEKEEKGVRSIKSEKQIGRVEDRGSLRGEDKMNLVLPLITQKAGKGQESKIRNFARNYKIYRMFVH